MCLVLAFTNTKKLKLSECLNEIGNTLLKEEDDGFGYAVQGKDGVFGEKTISKRFRTRLNRINQVNLPIVKKSYMGFGTASELTGPGIFHGRTSTNYISLVDTHPMQLEGWNLIHNGVVDDFGAAYTKVTDNDSEDVLRRLLDSVGKPNPMEDIEKYLEGYYAFAAIDPQGRLHVGRDNIAPLHIAYSAKYETFIIGTTEALILKVSKIIDGKIGPIDEVQDETYCIFNGNDLIHCQDFNSRGYTSRQSQHANLSLGRNLSNSPAALPGGAVSCGLTPAPEREVIDIGGGEIIDVSSTANRKKQVPAFLNASEAEWQDSIMDFLKESERHPDRRGVSEDSYYQYKKEIDNMDAAYQIYDSDDKPMDLNQFKKLDHVAQEMCTIIRPDGTVLDPIDYGTPRLRGRHGND